MLANKRIIIKEGRTTPSVVNIAPNIPFWLNPIKVAIFIANGPGVDSLIAMKSIISFSDNIPNYRNCSFLPMSKASNKRETAPIKPKKTTTHG